MREAMRAPTPLHDAAWPELFENLQAAYAELTRAQKEMRSHSDALEHANDLLDRVLESMQDSVLILDRTGRIVRANEAAGHLLDIPTDAICGRGLPDVWAAPLPATPAELVARSPEGALHDIEVELTIAGRAPRALLAACSLVRDKRGRIIGMLAVARDVTERKRADEQLREADRRKDEFLAMLAHELREADRRKDEFLAMLAHELRNPLAAIRNAFAVLRRVAPVSPQVEELLRVVDRQANRLTRHVDDLLEVSRITSGKIALQLRVIDVRDPARRAVDALHASGRASDHQVLLTVAAEPLTARADDVRIEQVVANLLDNAIKYTPAGGRVEVVVRREGADCVIRVRDTGSGIAPEDLPYVFDTFVQADRTLARSQGGLGLGLALVRGLVERQGGTVAASSEGRGLGATITVRLPFVHAALELEPAPADALTVPARRILIVEDNADVREALRALLEFEGHHVDVAADGIEGLERLRAEAFDVGIVDVGLPRLSGYELAERIRSEEQGRRSYLVAVTGYGQPGDRQRALESGFDAHLVKPVDHADLMHVLAAASTTAAPGG